MRKPLVGISRRMKYLTIFLFVTINLTGQSADLADNEIVNCIQNSDTLTPYFYLLKDQKRLFLRERDRPRLINNLKIYLDSSEIASIISHALADSLVSEWNCLKIDRARCVTRQTRDKMLPRPVYKVASRKESRRFERRYRRDKEFRDKIEFMRDSSLKAHERPRHERSVTEFSKVYYDSTRNFALIQEVDCGDCCFGATYLLKIEKGRWKIIAVDLVWAS